MLITRHLPFASLLLACLMITSSTAKEPQFNAVTDDWLQVPSGLQTMGNAHGDVAISKAGDVYVSITGGPRAGIQVYSSDGTYLRNVKDAPADFHGFVIHQEEGGEFIYGASLGGQTLYKLKLDGTVILKVPATVIPDKYKNAKKAVRLTATDVAPDGRIFVVDGYGRDFIHIFGADGTYQNSFGGREAPYQFKTCHKIAIDTRYDEPRVLCCDRENRRVVQLSIDGKVLQVIPEMKRPAAVAIHGDYAAIGEIEGRVSLLDKEGNTVKTLGHNTTKGTFATNKVKPEDWRTGIFTAPHGVDFDSNGNLFVSEYNQSGRVIRYDHK